MEVDCACVYVGSEAYENDTGVSTLLNSTEALGLGHAAGDRPMETFPWRAVIVLS